MLPSHFASYSPTLPSSCPQAFAIFEEMKQAGLAADTVTFGTLFSLCGAARQGHCALQVGRSGRRSLAVDKLMFAAVCQGVVCDALGANLARCMHGQERLA